MMIIAISGWKNSGKTSLVERLTAEFLNRGLSVSTIKHAHQNFDIDQIGTDSFRHRAAGASEVLVSSPRRWALMHENHDGEASLSDLLAKLAPVNVVIVEGFKGTDIPKIETRRRESTKGDELAPNDHQVIAVASDAPAKTKNNPPEFDLANEKAIADFILNYFDTKEGGGNDSRGPSIASQSSQSAMPPGVDWIPVDEALQSLRYSTNVVVGISQTRATEALGKILAQDVKVKRPNPPATNSAVDGYGFQFANSLATTDRCKLKLVEGRAAAGEPFKEILPQGHAVRVLTGSPLPEGVDTVVLDEWSSTDATGWVQFKCPNRRGANTRLVGEDLQKGMVLFAAGRQIQVRDMASLTASGQTKIHIRKKLRVAIISTGSEIVSNVTTALSKDKIIDANRPMLTSIIKKWGYEIIDLGIVQDQRSLVRQALDQAAACADAILISGGASAGDEDHVAKILTDKGDSMAWRIAIKPGRPLALSRWKDTLVFALPGNPVAALVCTLIFARPALHVLAGGQWCEPAHFMVPANFEKVKKPGRREYIRAMLNQTGSVEAFHSEGSGLTRGLAWADGLVELGDEAEIICKGSLVRFIPYSSFGL